MERIGPWAPLLAVALAGCTAGSSAAPATMVSHGFPSMAEWFTDEAGTTGLDFVHVNGMSGKFHFPEMMGPGAAFLDFDSDGDLDVYLVQGRSLEPGAASHGPSDRLYRNDLSPAPDGRPLLRFTDVTKASGIQSRGYGMGVTTGDVDNDGCPDLFLTRFGDTQLLRNRCNGTFEDVTERSGTRRSGWSVSSSFFDFDRDSWLDLYVGDYVTYDVARHTDCFTPSGKPDYCSPSAYRSRPSRLYRNRGDGTFADVTDASGISAAFGPGLGVSSADFDGDGWLDLYIANDGRENQLWMNQRNGTFRNTALLAGVAVNGHGRAEGSMGVDAGDFDNDGDEDLVIANLTGEGATLYVNDGTARFDDGGGRSGLRLATLRGTGFGARWFDVDNDTHLDVLFINGAVRLIEAHEQARDAFPLRQPNQLFRGVGDGRFEDVSAKAGATVTQSNVGRGAAFGDVDNDGDIDVLVAVNNGAARLLINRAAEGHHWIGLRLVGGRPQRDMLGARVAIIRDENPPLWARAHTDGSYASASDPRVVVGLGASDAPVRVRVVWPSGRTEEWSAVSIDRYTTLVEGGAR
jgi:hypothetical protein